MKKLLISVLSSLAIGSSLYGFNLSVNSNFKNGYVYDQDFIANQASYLVSPININFSDIQSELGDNESVFIYPYFGTSDKINVEFGVNILATIELTKTKIVYFIQENKNWKQFNNLGDFKSALKNYADKITDATEKSNFEGDYITQATSDHIIHNKLYTISTSKTSSIKVPVPVSIQQNSANENNDVNNSFFPPQIPNSQ